MRTKKAIYNITASMIAQIVSIVCGLITPRLILSAFGSTYNGVINSATQFLSVVSILRLGIAGATRVALYKTIASNDILGTSRIMKATNNYMRKIAGVIVAYSLLLMLIYPLISNNDLSNAECALIVGIVSISVFAEYFFSISNITLLSADQADYITSILNSIALIANCCLTAVLIRMHCSIFVVKFGSVMVFLITPAFMNWYVKRKYKLISNCEPDNSAIKGRGAVAFHSIANIVHANTDIILLTIFTDAKIISVYTVYSMVTGKIRSLVQIFMNGMEAAFGNMWAKKEYDTLKIVFDAFETGIFTLTTILFSCMGVLILSFIQLYTKGVTDVNYIRPGLAVLVTITEAVFCIRQPYLLMVQAAGCYEETKKGAMYEAVINLTVSIILINALGLNGVIIGTLVANLFRTIQYVIFVSKNLIKKSIPDFLKHCIVSVVEVFLIILCSRAIGHFILDNSSWIIWLVKGIAVFLSASFICIIVTIIFYKNDFQYLYSKILSLINNKRGH